MEWREVYSIEDDRFASQRMIKAISVLILKEMHVKLIRHKSKRPNDWVVLIVTVSFTL